MLVYEPALEAADFYHSKVMRDLSQFKQLSDVIVANRQSEELRDVAFKVYTRDLFGVDWNENTRQKVASISMTLSFG